MLTKRSKENYNYSYDLSKLLQSSPTKKQMTKMTKSPQKQDKKKSPIKKLQQFDEERALTCLSNQIQNKEQYQRKELLELKNIDFLGSSICQKPEIRRQISLGKERNRSNSKRDFDLQIQSISSLESQMSNLLQRVKKTKNGKVDKKECNKKTQRKEENLFQNAVTVWQDQQKVEHKKQQYKKKDYQLRQYNNEQKNSIIQFNLIRIQTQQSQQQRENNRETYVEPQLQKNKICYTRTMDDGIKKIRERIQCSEEKTKLMEEKYLNINKKSVGNIQELIQNARKLRANSQSQKQMNTERESQKSARRKNIGKRTEQIKKLQNQQSTMKYGEQQNSRTANYLSYLVSQKQTKKQGYTRRNLLEENEISTKMQKINRNTKQYSQSNEIKVKLTSQNNKKRADSQTRRPSTYEHGKWCKSLQKIKKSEKQKILKEELYKKIAIKLNDQILLDKKLGDARKKFMSLDDLDKWKKLKKSLNKYGINHTQRELHNNLKIQTNQIDPFSTKQPIYGDCIGTLSHLFANAQKFWNQSISGTINSQQINDYNLTAKEIDLNKRGYIAIEDLVCFINLYTDNFLRSRDMVYTFRRFIQLDSMSNSMSNGISYHSFIDKFI